MIDIGLRNLLLVISSLTLLIAYAKVAKQVGSYFSLITPWFILLFIKNIVVELLYTNRIGGDGTDFSFFLVTVANTAEVLALLLAYYYTNGFSISLFKQVIPSYWRESLILVFLAIFLFLPIYHEFGLDVVLSPRDVYMQTRTGYGLNYFISAFFLKLSFIFVIFSLCNNWRKIFIALVVFSALSVVFGSKASILSFLVFVFIYWVKHTKFQIGFRSFASLVVVAFFVLTAAVALLRPSTVDKYEMGDLFDILLNFSDYNRNAQLVIDNEHKPQFGRIVAEDYILSKVPRVLYPDKPKNFGSYELSETYFPEWFYADTGSPAFGAGATYADFGIFFILWLMLSGFVQGYILKIVERTFMEHPNPYSFVIMLNFCGFSLFSAGAGSFFIETIVVLWLLSKVNNFGFSAFIFGENA